MEKTILEKLTLYELREMGRTVGVKSPSSLKKKRIDRKNIENPKGRRKANVLF